MSQIHLFFSIFKTNLEVRQYSERERIYTLEPIKIKKNCIFRWFWMFLQLILLESGTLLTSVIWKMLCVNIVYIHLRYKCYNNIYYTLFHICYKNLYCYLYRNASLHCNLIKNFITVSLITDWFLINTIVIIAHTINVPN